jgi:hypothetical protein
METKKSMDSTQVAMLCTNSEQIYMAERTKGDYFASDSDPDKKGTGITKEPTVAVCAYGKYPIRYLLEFFKLGKANKATHVKFELGRENRPLRLEFESRDALNMENGIAKLEKTWMYCAPMVDNDYVDPPKEKILEYIALYENEIVLLKNKLPKEEPKAL